MNVQNINGLPPSTDNYKSSKRRTEAPDGVKTDRVLISQEAKQKQSIDSLQNLVSDYLKRIPAIRKNLVEEASRKIRDGYHVDHKKLTAIAEQIQDQFRL